MMQLELNELKRDLEQEQEIYELLRQESVDLRDEFKALFPARVCPVFLSRNPDKSLTPLFWRYSSSHKGKKGLRPKVDDFWALISRMSESDKNKLAEFELNKIRLNYQIGMSAYKNLKLLQAIEGLGSWENNIRTM